MRHLLAALLLAAIATLAPAQDWPQRPVRIIVPAPAGSSLDVVARTLGAGLQRRWRGSVLVENKAGAGGLLGMDAVAKAVPDGHTLGIGFNGPIAYAPFMHARMPYDPHKALLPIVLLTSQPNVLAIHAGTPAKTLPEFVAWARRQGDRLSYGSVGNGSASHLSGELFATQAGLKAVHVPYNGAPPAAIGLASGETQLLFAVAPGLLPMVRSGRVRLLAVASAQRVPSMKELPTLAEEGLPGFESIAWNGLFAPAGVPAALVARINADVNSTLREPAVREALARQGLSVAGGSPTEFEARIAAEARRWGPVITRAGIRIE